MPLRAHDSYDSHDSQPGTPSELRISDPAGPSRTAQVPQGTHSISDFAALRIGRAPSAPAPTWTRQAAAPLTLPQGLPRSSPSRARQKPQRHASPSLSGAPEDLPHSGLIPTPRASPPLPSLRSGPPS